MKKIISLALVLCMFFTLALSLASCSKDFYRGYQVTYEITYANNITKTLTYGSNEHTYYFCDGENEWIYYDAKELFTRTYGSDGEWIKTDAKEYGMLTTENLPGMGYPNIKIPLPSNEDGTEAYTEIETPSDIASVLLADRKYNCYEYSDSVQDEDRTMKEVKVIHVVDSKTDVPLYYSRDWVGGSPLRAFDPDREDYDPYISPLSHSDVINRLVCTELLAGKDVPDYAAMVN